MSRGTGTLTVGVVLVDELLEIMHANAAVTAMLRVRDPIRSHQGLLMLPYATACKAFQAAGIAIVGTHVLLDGDRRTPMMTFTDPHADTRDGQPSRILR